MIYTVTLNPAIDRQLTVPTIERDTVLRAVESRVDPGGKGFNVSRMVAALGGVSVALGFVGGHAGAWLREALEQRGLASDFVGIAGETRMNTSIVALDGGGYVKANEAGGMVSAENLHSLHVKIEQLAAPGDYWVLAGSLPPGVPTTIYADLVTVLQKKGARPVLDASGDALRFGLAAAPFLAKPNDTEAEQFTGKREPVAAMRALSKTGVQHVVMSRGKEGALLLENGRLLRIVPPEIVERNPIGAGDAMVGGLVFGLHDGMSLREAVCLGAACGAAAAQLDGTDFGSGEDVEVLLKQVRIEEMEP